MASTPPKNKRGGEKPPNTPPNNSPTNRSPMRSPTASRGGSISRGMSRSGGVRGILRRGSARTIAERPRRLRPRRRHIRSVRRPGAGSIDFDGLPRRTGRRARPRRGATRGKGVDARLDDDAFEHPAVMQRRVDDGYSSSASSVEAEFETFHANGSPKANGSPAGKANRAAGAPRSKSRSPPSPSARASPKSMFGKVVGVFRGGGGGAWTTTTHSWSGAPYAEQKDFSLTNRESNDHVLEKLRAHAERGDAERRA